MNWDAFFTLHSDLPREGPGTPEDVDWAVRQAGVADGARILDAGAGPGGDVGALLDAVPGAHVTAVDSHADFVEQIATRFDSDRVDARQGDMLEVVGPYDFIWSAGAVYFHGIEATLSRWRTALAPGGHVAFSHPCHFTEPQSEAAEAFWQGEAVATADGIAAEIVATGYEVIATRPVGDAGWEAYFGPLEVRIAQLRQDADDALSRVLDEQEAEIAAWRAVKAETGYLLSVVRPI